jgi:Glucodextranase, domain B/PASTA domain
MRPRPATITRTVVAVTAATAAALAVAACGQSTVHHAAPVQLSQLSPSDGVRVSSDRVTVAGTVKPHHASVMVLGKRVKPASNGHFSTSVPLQVGTNLIDVIADSKRAQPAMTAVRVVRYVLVSVPSVTGRSPRSAAAAIRAAGLVPKVHGSSDPFSFLVPLSSEVCSQSPAPDKRVVPGTAVTLSVGKVCF